jgi:4,5-dihydroxyphthalate decarboxylase
VGTARRDLAEDLFAAFAASKQRYVAALRANEIVRPTAVDRMHQRVVEITGTDPLPYGIEPNRAVLDELVGHAVSQHILSRAPEVESLFAAGTRSLVG